MHRRLFALAAAGILAAGSLLAAGPRPAEANHSWGTYHWARTSNPFTLRVGDNVDSRWDAYLVEAIRDWNQSTVLDLEKVAGGTAPKSCRPTAGRIEACNASYGNNGWLGIAQIWLSGGHISQAITKLNDYYFNQPQYNTPAWRRLVTCQEIAHDFGLDHQDENFNNANVGSCMDYTNDPDGGAGGAASNDPSNEHPNSHDFQQIQASYSHLDDTTTIRLAAANSERGRSDTADDAGPNNPADFGQPVGPRDGKGRPILFVKPAPNGQRLFTHVFWTLEATP
jgi:hypothetical protein